MASEKTMKTYEFKTVEYRAQAIRVVDGDTCHLFVDRGNYDYSIWMVRLHGVNTPELRPRKGTEQQKVEERARAGEAMAQLSEWLRPGMVKDIVSLKSWPLRMRTYRDPDAFGRWLVELYWLDEDGTEHHVNGELVAGGFAVPFRA